MNFSHGCWIDEHWKGPISIGNSKFLQNQESGLTIKAEKFPKNYETNHQSSIHSQKADLQPR